MGYDAEYTGREIIDIIHQAPDVDYVGEFLIGVILADKAIGRSIKEVEKLERPTKTDTKRGRTSSSKIKRSPK